MYLRFEILNYKIKSNCSPCDMTITKHPGDKSCSFPLHMYDLKSWFYKTVIALWI